ncbi:hypothetical protein [Flindersiella endophytica]
MSQPHTHEHTHEHPHDHAPGECDTTGRHGMLLFGEDVLYLSHLPMYACPHNFQVLLAVELDEAAAKTLRDDRELNGNGQYTVDPTVFPIAELESHEGRPERTSLQATLVRGHFERGGTPIASDIIIGVRKVVRFSELDLTAEPDADRASSYLCFGQTGQLYLAHELSARPNYDHVLRVRFVPGSMTNQMGAALADDLTGLHFDTAQPVTFTRHDIVKQRLRPGEVVTGSFRFTSAPGGARGFTVGLEVERELYLEINELA